MIFQNFFQKEFDLMLNYINHFHLVNYNYEVIFVYKPIIPICFFLCVLEIYLYHYYRYKDFDSWQSH